VTVRSSGLLLFRRGPGGPEVLLGHMGGPFWAARDEHAWSIPKGLHEKDEADDDGLAVAEREFAEEMGQPPPAGATVALGTVRSGSKIISAFAREGDLDPATVVSNTFEMEWPRGSGRIESFPEIDRAAWVDVERARRLLVKGQLPYLERLLEAIGS
jgi:predicted NUDIX family NTP pyrophosphohydrolase